MTSPESKPVGHETKFPEGSSAIEIIARTLKLNIDALRDEVRAIKEHPELIKGLPEYLKKKGVQANLESLHDKLNTDYNLHIGIIKKIE